MLKSNLVLDIAFAIEDVLKKNLNGNDHDVVSSLHQYYLKNGKLTERQQSYLNNILEKYSAVSEEWIAAFDDSKREQFKLAIKYYRNTPYFHNIISQYDLNNNFIPSRRQYEKMCENKYVVRAIENYKKPAKYSVGDMICWRKSIYRGKDLTVGLIEYVCETPSYHAGNRRYKVLWLSDGQKSEVSERNIKLYRQPSKKSSVPAD